MMRLDSVSIIPSACSATPSLLAPDWFTTATPCAVQAVDVNRVVAGAVGGYRHQIGQAFQQGGRGVEVWSDLLAGSADLVNMRGGQHRRHDILRALILQPVQLHVGPLPQDLRIERRGKVFHVEYAFRVRCHSGFPSYAPAE